MISIENCKKHEIKSIQNFIRLNYKKKHILTSNLKLFDWLYKTEENKYNFLLLKKSQKIFAVLGYIPTNKFNKNKDKDKKLIWLALLCGKKKNPIQGAGIILLKFLHQKFPDYSFAVNSIGEKVIPLYKAFGYNVIRLRQYYIINPNMTQKIIKGNIKKQKKSKSYKSLKLKFIDKKVLEKIKLKKNYIHSKSTNYFINKYLKNPFFKYKIALIIHKKVKKMLIILRVDKYKNSKVLRIVDLYGDYNYLAFCNKIFLELLKSEKAEFLDFLQYGISHKILNKCNFRLNNYGKTIIPIYFSPYLNKNMKIFSAYKSNKQKIFILKADGDQDIPH